MEKVILFDLDGTLIDSTEAIVGCFYHAFEEQNFDFKGTIDDITSEIGYPLEEMFGSLGADKEKISDFVNSYKNEYKKVSQEKTILLDKAKESVILASTFARLGVVTTKTTHYSTLLLEHFGILKYFEIVIGRQEVTHPKPHPEPIHKALESMKVVANKGVFMIGDTKLDIIAAKSAKISNIAVLCGYGKKEELLKYTDNIVKDSLEAVKRVQNF